MSVQAQLHIPDLWFDFYSRFLPGAVFVAATRIFIFGNKAMPSYAELIVLALAGYLFGLLSQPISSRLTRLVETLADKASKVQIEYVASIQKKIGRNLRESLILSKMHGEVNFFCQLAVLSGVYQIIQRKLSIETHQWSQWYLSITLVSVIFAFEVAMRRVAKAKKYDR